MGWNVLGLCYLVVGITGIVNCYFTPEDWKEKNRNIAEPFNWPSYKEWKNKGYYFKYKYLNDVFNLLDYQSERDMLRLHYKPTNSKLHYLLPHQRKLFEKFLITVSPLEIYRDGFSIPGISNYEKEDTYPNTEENKSSLSNTDLSIISSTELDASYSKLNLELNNKQTSSLMKDSTEPNLDFKGTASSVSSQTNTEYIETRERNYSNHESISPVAENLLLPEKQKNFSTQRSINEDVATNSATFYSDTLQEKKASKLSSSFEPETFSNSKTLSSDSFASHSTENPISDPVSVEDGLDASASYSTTSDMEEKNYKTLIYAKSSSVTEILAKSSQTPEKESSENTPSNIKSSSSTEVLPTSSQTSEKESRENTPSNIKSSISTDILAASSQTSEKETVSPNYISSTVDLDSLVTLTNKVTKDTNKDISSTESSAESVSSITKVIYQERVIQISSIHTARMVISVVFVVVFLIALAILGIYIFRIRRRAVEYDQLLLLP